MEALRDQVTAQATRIGIRVWLTPKTLMLSSQMGRCVIKTVSGKRTLT